MVGYFAVGAVSSVAAEVVVGSFPPMASILGVQSRSGGRSGVCVYGGGTCGGCLNCACGFVSSEIV